MKRPAKYIGRPITVPTRSAAGVTANRTLTAGEPVDVLDVQTVATVHPRGWPPVNLAIPAKDLDPNPADNATPRRRVRFTGYAPAIQAAGIHLAIPDQATLVEVLDDDYPFTLLVHPDGWPDGLNVRVGQGDIELIEEATPS